MKWVDGKDTEVLSVTMSLVEQHGRETDENQPLISPG